MLCYREIKKELIFQLLFLFGFAESLRRLKKLFWKKVS